MAKPADRAVTPHHITHRLVLPPVANATDHLESLGWIDKFVGNLRIDRQAFDDVLALSAETSHSDESGGPDADSDPADPSPIEIPPPVEDGTDDDTRGT